MTEEEEFEFQAQLEREQAAGTVASVADKPRRPTSTSGVISEAIKGIARGASALPKAIEESLGSQVRAAVPDKMKLSPDARISAMRDKFYEQIKPSLEASQVEQMLGTGAELATAILPFAGNKSSALKKAAEIFVPAAGGAVGEQLGGETGKMVGTLGAPFAQAAAGRMLAPKTSEELKMLMQAGVRPTPGQTLGGVTNRFEELPLIQEVTRTARARPIVQFNLATFNRALAPVGGKVDKVGFQGFEQAESIASDAFNKVLPNLKIKTDRQFIDDLRAVYNDTALAGARTHLSDVWNNVAMPLLNKPGQRWHLDPQDMKKIDSELGLLARQFGKDPAVESRVTATGLRNMQLALRTLVERQNPQFAEPLRAANSAWANLIRVERAVVSAGKTEGLFSPQQFMQAVKTTDTSLRHSKYAKGKALMQDWANAGTKVLGDNPNPHIPYAVLKNVGLLPRAAAGVNRGLFGVPFALGAGAAGTVYNPYSQAGISHLLASRQPWMRQAGMAIGSPGPSAFGTIPLFSQGEQ